MPRCWSPTPHGRIADAFVLPGPELKLSLRPFSQPWADRFREEINASDAYREAGRGWQWPLALIVSASPADGFPRAEAILLELRDGACHSACALPASDVNAPFAITGDAPAWKEVLAGTLDPVTGIVRQRLQLTGSLAMLMLHVRAAGALVGCASRVPTRFPDGSDA